MVEGFVVSLTFKGACPSAHVSTAIRSTKSAPSSTLFMSTEVEDEVMEKIVNIRPKAMNHLQELRRSQGSEGDIYLRMGVRSGGCSGLSYIMDLVKKEEVTEDDMVEEYDGFKWLTRVHVEYVWGLQENLLGVR
eukprot:g17703.t1